MANDWIATIDFGGDPNLAIGPEVEAGNRRPRALNSHISIGNFDFRRADDAGGRAGIQRLVKLRLKSKVRLCRWRFDRVIHTDSWFGRDIDQLELKGLGAGIRRTAAFLLQPRRNFD